MDKPSGSGLVQVNGVFTAIPHPNDVTNLSVGQKVLVQQKTSDGKVVLFFAKISTIEPIVEKSNDQTDVEKPDDIFQLPVVTDVIEVGHRKTRCLEDGCKNLSRTKSRCAKHIGKVCAAPGCVLVCSNDGYCDSHVITGNIQTRCAEKGCKNLARKKGRCTKHIENVCAASGCVLLKINDGHCDIHVGTGNIKSRCVEEGCKNLSRKKARCAKHIGKVCAAPGCVLLCVNDGHCDKHAIVGRQKSRCVVDGCNNLSVRKGICNKHKGKVCVAPGCVLLGANDGWCDMHVIGGLEVRESEGREQLVCDPGECLLSFVDWEDVVKCVPRPVILRYSLRYMAEGLPDNVIFVGVKRRRDLTTYKKQIKKPEFFWRKAKSVANDDYWFRHPGIGKVRLCAGYEVYIRQSFLDNIQALFSVENQLTGRPWTSYAWEISLELIGEKNVALLGRKTLQSVEITALLGMVSVRAIIGHVRNEYILNEDHMLEQYLDYCNALLGILPFSVRDGQHGEINNAKVDGAQELLQADVLRLLRKISDGRTRRNDCGRNVLVRLQGAIGKLRKIIRFLRNRILRRKEIYWNRVVGYSNRKVVHRDEAMKKRQNKNRRLFKQYRYQSRCRFMDTRRKRLRKWALYKKHLEREIKKIKFVETGKKEPGKRKKNKLGERYLKTINEKWDQCDCCSVMIPQSRLCKNIGNNHFNLELGHVLCEKCFASGCEEDDICKYSIELNNLDPGEEIKGMGYMELQAIRRIQPFIKIVRNPGALKSAKGQVLHVISDVGENGTALLPQPSSDIYLAVSQNKKKGCDKIVRYTVNFDTVFEMLEFLKKSNPFYYDIEINRDVHNEGDEETFVSFDVYDTAALLDLNSSIPIRFCMHGPERKLPYNSKPEFIINDGVEQMSYPHLFPFGKAGERSPRMKKLYLSEYYVLRFSSGDSRYQRDESYIFRCLNVYQKEQLLNGINYVFRENGKYLNKIGNVEDVLKRVYPQIGKRIRGSDAYFAKAKSHLRDMVDTLGTPNLFLSINLRNCSELLCNIDPERFGVPECPDFVEIDLVTDEEIIKMLNDNCGLAARMFERRTRQFMVFLKDKKNPVFPNNGYAEHLFVKVEFQRAGYPHLHILVWLNTKFNAETEGGKKVVLNFVDQFLTTEIPDWTDDLIGHLLVKKFQSHRHTFTCRKGSGKRIAQYVKKKRKSDEDTDKYVLEDEVKLKRKEERERVYCRFGFPHRLSKCSRFLSSQELKRKVKGDRSYTIKRLTNGSRRIVPYNLEFLKIFRCNMDVQVVTDVWGTIEYLFSYVTKPEGKERQIIQQVIEGSTDPNLKSRLLFMANAVLRHRQVGKVEAAMTILGIPFYYCSRSTTFVDLKSDSCRSRLLKKKVGRHDGGDIFVKNLVDHYRNRLSADNLGSGKEIMAKMCLYDFSRWFVTDKVSEVGENNDEEDGEIPEHGSSVVDLIPNGKWVEFGCEQPFAHTGRKLPRLCMNDGTVLRMRREPKILAFDKGHVSDKEDMRKLLNLLISVDEKDEDILVNEDCSTEEICSIFEKYVIDLRDKVNKLPNGLMAILNQIMDNLLDKGNGGRNEHIPYDIRTSRKRKICSVGDNIESIGDENDHDSEGFKTGLPDDYIEIDTRTFTAEQKGIFDCVDGYFNNLLKYIRTYRNNDRSHPEYPKPFHIFVQGAAGTGKSYLIMALIQRIKNFCVAEKTVLRLPRANAGILLGAFTGSAAVNVGGSTLHDLFGFGCSGTGDNVTVLNGGQLMNNLKEKIYYSLVLLIDEISLVPENLFLKVNDRMNEVCEVNNKADAYFGEKPVIVFGDFFQLRPVNSGFVFNGAENPLHVWNIFQPMFLVKVMRQAGDDEFRNHLEELREGHISDNFDLLLRSRCLEKFVNRNGFNEVKDEYNNEFADLPHLFVLVEDTKCHNRKKLEELAVSARTRQIYTIKSVDTMEAQKVTSKKVSSKVLPKISDDARKSCGLLGNLNLCIGASVMLTANLDTKSGLVNGARCKVKSFIWTDKNNNRCELDNAKLTVGSDKAIIKGLKYMNVPRPYAIEVVMENNDSVVEILLHRVSFQDLNGNKVSRMQFPLTLAYGMTIHKSQGATIKKGVLNLRFPVRFRPKGGFYTALSRFPSSRSFILLDYDRASFTFCVKAVKEIKRLQCLVVPLQGRNTRRGILRDVM